MKTALAVVMAVLAGACGIYLLWLMLGSVIERESKRAHSAGREEIAVETLRGLLRLQESTNAGWRAMARVAGAALHGAKLNEKDVVTSRSIEIERAE